MSAVPAKVASIVDARDEQKCFRCGVWIGDNGSRHHRQRRQVGGHTPENLILMCGSGTTGCHGWVHAHPMEAKSSGYIVSTWESDVASVPVRIHALAFLGAPTWVLLDAEGHRTRVADTHTANVSGGGCHE